MARLNEKPKIATCQALVGRRRNKGGTSPIGTKATILPTKFTTNGHPPIFQSSMMDRKGTKFGTGFATGKHQSAIVNRNRI